VFLFFLLFYYYCLVLIFFAYRSGKKKRKYAVADRMTIEEIYENVASSRLTFDYIAMLIVAALIGAVGLFVIFCCIYIHEILLNTARSVQ
jgi:hypothetical protein